MANSFNLFHIEQLRLFECVKTLVGEGVNSLWSSLQMNLIEMPSKRSVKSLMKNVQPLSQHCVALVK